MQALRSLFSRARATKPDPVSSKPPVEIEAHRLAQVAGGLPRIGGNCTGQAPSLSVEPLPRIGS